MFARLFTPIKENIQNNPFTWSLAMTAVADSLVDNYWVFTNIPLGQNGSDPGLKFLYLLGQTLLEVAKWGAVGHGVDVVRGLRPSAGYTSI